jgi:hypothetical protein
MTTPKRGPGRPRKTAVQPLAPKVAVTNEGSEPTVVCDCKAKVEELEKRLRFLEIRIL